MEQQGARQPLTGEARLEAYLDAIVGGLGHARRAASARAYCTGLLLPGERKSIEPMAARLDPAHVQAKHQSLHHVVGCVHEFWPTCADEFWPTLRGSIC